MKPFIITMTLLMLLKCGMHAKVFTETEELRTLSYFLLSGALGVWGFGLLVGWW